MAMDKKDLNSINLPHEHGQKGAQPIYDELKKVDRFERAGELFKHFCEPNRLKILYLLSHRDECVDNISVFLGLSYPTVCHHLRALKESGLIELFRQDGEVYYRATERDGGNIFHLSVENLMDMSCPANPDSSTADTVRQIHDYLIEHLAERISISNLSKLFALNPTTLKAEFKKIYGVSITAHINEHRIKTAEKLLAETALSVEKIATAVGFSPSKFTALFKRERGITPLKYRKNIREF